MAVELTTLSPVCKVGRRLWLQLPHCDYMVSYVEFEEFLLIAYENVKEGLGLPSVLSLENSKLDNPI